MRAFLLACFLQACATVPWSETRLPCLKREWVLLESKHFDLYSDRPQEVVAEMLVDLERVFAAFLTLPDLGVPLTSPPPGRITVVVFASASEFSALHDATWANGLYVTVHNEPEPRPVILIHEDLGHESRELIIHELSHRFLLHAAPAAPRWLLEGLAEYQSSLELTDREARLGAGPLKYFHFNATMGPPWKLFQERAGEQFYPMAFSLVHLLNDTRERQEAFHRYLSLLAQGVPPTKAFSESIGALDWDLLGRELQTYLPQFRYVTRVLPYRRREIWFPPARLVTHAELHRLWAAIRPWRPSTAALVERDLAESEMLEPGSPDTRYLMAAFRLASGDTAAAAAELEPLLRAAPMDVRLRTLAALLASESERAKPMRERSRTLGEIQKLAPLATTPAARQALAQLWASVGRAAEALASSEAGLRDNPADDRLHALRAWALHESARDAEAVAEMSIAISLTPHGRIDPRRQRLLEEYQKGAAAKNQ